MSGAADGAACEVWDKVFLRGKMMRKYCFLTFVLPLLAFGAAPAVRAADASEAQTVKEEVWTRILSLHRDKQYNAAYELALRHENNGDARIWAFLGDCLCFGFGTERDHGRGFGYYRKAAERIPYAKFRMGLFYAVGEVVPCDKDKACDLMWEAMSAGYRPDAKLVMKLSVLLQSKLSEYTDPILKLRFPERSPKFNLMWLQRYPNRRVLGYSLRYGGTGEWLDLFIYDGGLGAVPDGVSPASDKALRDAEAEVMYLVRSGRYGKFRDRTETLRGRLPLSKQDYAWFSFVYDPGRTKDLRSVILIFGARGKFFKIRYTGTPEKGVPAAQLPTMVADFLGQLDSALNAK